MVPNFLLSCHYGYLCTKYSKLVRYHLNSEHVQKILNTVFKKSVCNQIYINPYFNFICLGPAQLVAWTALPQGQCQLDEKIPFVLDTCEETFSGIDLLLNEVWDGLDGRREW